MDDALHGRLVELDDGYTTALRDEGTGPAIVFVHPTPLDRRVWDGIFGRLPGRRVIAYDLRGHGAARATPVPAFCGPLADDLAHLLDVCGVAEAHIVGLGYGGAVGQAFALRHPTRLTSLTLIGARADPHPLLSVTARHILRDALAGQTAALERWFSPQELAADGAAVRYARTCVREIPPATFADALESVAAFDVADRLAQIDRPVRVIATDRDVVVPIETARAVAGRLPHGELRLVTDAGPLLPLEDPERFAGLLDHLATPVQYQAA